MCCANTTHEGWENHDPEWVANLTATSTNPDHAICIDWVCVTPCISTVTLYQQHNHEHIGAVVLHCAQGVWTPRWQWERLQ